MKTREEWNEVILADARGMLEHISAKKARDVRELMGIARAACASFLRGEGSQGGPFTTRDCLMVAVLMMQLIREMGMETSQEQSTH